MSQKLQEIEKLGRTLRTTTYIRVDLGSPSLPAMCPTVHAPSVNRDPIVFVVDDDEPVRDSTCALIESYGLNVSAYASAAALLLDVDLQHGDCMVLDNHMPGMTGIELVETLRTRGIRIPVIMFTGRTDAVLKQRALRAGVLIVLDKPVNEDHLLQAISVARLLANEVH